MKDFNTYWNEDIKALKENDINTVTGKTNKIIDVTDNFLKRKSSQGNESEIPKILFENVFDDLIKNKEITRAYINSKYGKRCSSIITVILEKHPNISLITSPTISLKIK